MSLLALMPVRLVQTEYRRLDYCCFDHPLNNSPPFLYLSLNGNQLRGQALVRYTGSMPTKHLSNKSGKKGWKTVQSRAKRGRQTKLALAVLGLIAGILILSWAIRFTQSLFSPWKIQTGIQKKYLWNEEFNLNLLVRSSEISILSLNPKEEKVIIVNIPEETFLEVPYGFGSWQLRAIYELGETQKGVGGHKLLADTLTNFLAIPIDGFLDLSGLSPRRSTIEIVDILRKNPVFMLNLLSDLKTNLTVWELLRLDLKLSRVRFDKVEELSLDKLDVLDKENLPDGTPIFTGDPVKLDSALSDLADPAITSEYKTIAVFNGTSKGQLAVKWARLIRNLGGNVIITGNTEETKNTKVTGVKSATLKRLQQIFGSTDIKDSEGTSTSRAQINLLLGEDYVNK